MDHETRELALLALKNAFYTDFSGLVNAYLKAAEGLAPPAYLEAEIHRLSNVFSRAEKAEGDNRPIIYTTDAGGWSSGFDTIAQALDYDKAVAVYLQAEKVFERRDGEWYFVGDA